MKSIKQHIIEEITRLQEAEYDVPEEIISALKDKLQMNPIERFVEKFKAVNSIPPSYRVFLHNGQFFDVVYEAFSLMIKSKGKEWYVADRYERAEAVKAINDLLTVNQMIPDEAGEEKEEDPLMKSLGLDKSSPPSGGGGSKPTGRPPGRPPGGGGGATSPPPKPADEPADEPDDKPAEEEPMV